MNQKYKFIYLPILLLIGFVFYLKGLFFLDPDFGWHYRIGELISVSGIPQTDPFSYTMPSFPFVDHEWLTNVAIKTGYNLFGMQGLSILGLLVALLSLLIVIKGEKGDQLFKISLLLLASGTLLAFEGVRPQVQSWLWLVILVKVIFNETLWKKWRLFLPLLFLAWANLHGSFGVGIATLIVMQIIRSFSLKKINISDILVTVACVTATLINPYGIQLWREFLMQLSDGSLRWTIQEWMPAIFQLHFAFIFLSCFSIVLLIKYRNKFLLKEKIFYIGFLFWAFSSQRNIPLWLIFGLPVILKGVEFLKAEVLKTKGGQERLEKVNTYLFIGSFAVFVITSLLVLSQKQKNELFYPVKATEYLKNNLPKDQIFSEYGWGGYLIWKLPEKKVFIDGRMPSWRYDNCPSTEACYAMRDYGNLLSGETPYQEIFKKYNIKLVFWPKPAASGLLDKLEQLLIQPFKKESSFNFLNQLEKDGWKKIYEDEVAVIYSVVQ